MPTKKKRGAPRKPKTALRLHDVRVPMSRAEVSALQKLADFYGEGYAPMIRRFIREKAGGVA